MLGCAPPPPEPPSPPLALATWERVPLGGGTPAAPALVAAADGAFLLAWESRDDAGCELRIARRAADGRWSEPARLDDDPASSPLEPQLAAGPAGRVVAAWQSGDDGVRIRISPDGGATWRPSVAAADGGPASLPAVAVDSRGRAVVAWEDRRDGDRDVRVRIVGDDHGAPGAGASLRADSDRAGAASSFHPRLAVPAPDVLLVLWWDDRSGLSDLFVRRSTDGGAAWDGPELRLDPGPPGASASHAARFVEAGPNAVEVAWEEIDRAEDARVYRRRSADHGATWEAAQESAAGLPDPAEVRAVSAAGDTLLVRVRPGPDGPELAALLRRQVR